MKIIFFMKIFYTFIFLFFLSNSSSSEINNLNKNCKGNLNKINFNNERPVSINVETLNPRKWTKNLLKMLSETQFINKAKYITLDEYRNFHKAKVIVNYKYNISCIYKGEVKIHGGTRNHRENKNQTTSLRIKLFDGHILNHTHFALLLPKSRNGDNEVFGASLFRQLNFISPLTFYTKTKVNNIIPYKVIFQARDDNEVLFYNNTREGIVFAGNKTRGDKVTSLSRISNINFSNQFSKQLLFSTLDKLNTIYLFGFSEKILNKYKNINYFNLSVYEALVISMGGGLEKEDRKFYYNFSREFFEPIFNDTDLTILNKNFTKTDNLNLNKKAIDEALFKLNSLDIQGLQNEIAKNNLIMNEDELRKIILKINNNLQTLGEMKDLKNKENPLQENDIINLYIQNLIKNDFKIAFYHDDKNIKICSLKNKECSLEKISQKKLLEILSEQYLDFKNSKVKFVLNNDLYNNKINFKNDTNFKNEIKIDNLKIKFTDGIKIKSDNENRIIEINQTDKAAKILIYDSLIENWRISIRGPNKVISKLANTLGLSDEEVNRHMGCLTFKNIKFKDASLEIRNLGCKNSVHIINSNGNITNYLSNNTSNDALDIDFSNINFDDLEISNSGSECISLKTGYYKFFNLSANNCMHGISIGENGFLEIENLNFSFADIAITAKDSSNIILENAKIDNTGLCLFAMKKNINFDGSIIKYRKNNFFCKDKIKKVQDSDEFSEISFF